MRLAGRTRGSLATMTLVREHPASMHIILINILANWTMISPTELPSSITSTARPPETTVTLSDSGWLSCLYEGRRILVWLPVERRGKVFAGHGRRVVVGARSGAVTVLELPTAHA
jgi:hypothetical protein